MGLEVGLEVNPLAASKFFFLLVSYWPASILPAPDKYAILIYKVASYHITSPRCACQVSKVALVAYNPGNHTHICTGMKRRTNKQQIQAMGPLNALFCQALVSKPHTSVLVAILCRFVSLATSAH